MQLRDFVKDGELRRPTMFDANGEECFFVVKNGTVLPSVARPASNHSSVITKSTAFTRRLWRSPSTPTATGTMTALSPHPGTPGPSSVTPTIASSECSSAVWARPILLMLPMRHRTTSSMSVSRRPSPTPTSIRSRLRFRHRYTTTLGTLVMRSRSLSSCFYLCDVFSFSHAPLCTG